MLRTFLASRPILAKVMVFILCLVIVASLYGIALLLLARQLPVYQKYWQARAVEPAAANAITYIAMGDSTAQGIGATSPNKGYVGLIAEAITQKTGRPVHLINISKSGAKVDDVLYEQLPRLQELKVDENTVITIEIGANDAAHNFNAQQFENSTKQLLTKLPKQAIISDLPYFGKGRLAKQESTIQEANQILNRMAMENGRTLAPLHEITQQHASWLNNALDLFHPSNRGYENWYLVFWKQLQPTIQ